MHESMRYVISSFRAFRVRLMLLLSAKQAVKMFGFKGIYMRFLRWRETGGRNWICALLSELPVRLRPVFQTKIISEVENETLKLLPKGITFTIKTINYHLTIFCCVPGQGSSVNLRQLKSFLLPFKRKKFTLPTNWFVYLTFATSSNLVISNFFYLIREKSFLPSFFFFFNELWLHFVAILFQVLLLSL